MIQIIDYGLGNTGSIYNMLKKIGVKSEIVDNPVKLNDGSKYILPGVGSFDNGMKLLKNNNWIEKLNELIILKKNPILGICLGMQLMTKSSEEGIIPGLSWIDADVKKFSFKDNNLKIPHMGWNNINPIKNNKLFYKLNNQSRFYHVHSYYVLLNDSSNEIASTNYSKEFTSSFQKDNIFGVQFHPEKSHKYGMQLLSNFSKI
jgi:imidazole glycerol-phosphate synthase subunit HisH